MMRPNSLLNVWTGNTLFERIANICDAVNAATNDQDLLEISLRKTLELFNCERGSIFIADPKRKKLVLRSAVGMKSTEKEKLEKRLGEGVIGSVALLKSPLFVKNIAADKRFPGYKARHSYKTPSFLCAPLLLKDQLIGVITLTDKKTKKNFTASELLLLDFLAAQIALNFRRVELYDKFQQAVAESKELKTRIGQSERETRSLQKKIIVQEKFATIGKLTAGIAHEINNPLDGALRYTNLCLGRVNNDLTTSQYLNEIKTGLQRMTGIVQNLLACSRNEFPERQAVDFTQALDYALSAVQPELARKNIILKRDIRGNIPLIPDKGLERILVNLLNNALDALKRYGRLTIKAQRVKARLLFSVTDNGHGIHPETLERIFEPFFTTKDRQKGCGLGLTIVGEIVKSYNGEISVDSAPGKGTTFRVNLPIPTEFSYGANPKK
ncbi:MAG: GAF domain-containing sensor histidine kinase [Candidatus Omnitrophica bacterium]|nr:GAF domain-containing sensor histidine kinase [Candidatus Omnitrophota bacterium]